MKLKSCGMFGQDQQLEPMINGRLGIKKTRRGNLGKEGSDGVDLIGRQVVSPFILHLQRLGGAGTLHGYSKHASV